MQDKTQINYSKNDPIMDISKLKTIRKGLKMKLSDVSAECGVDRGMISLIESGKGNPTIKTLDKICKVYGVTTGIIL